MNTRLPIVERELRVAARKRSTFWVRIVAGFTAVVIGGGFIILQLAINKAGFGRGLFQLGSTLFMVLSWMGVIAALSAGVFFTSDCLSEEKRDGTLGLLFLTDLRSHDVVMGKLLVTSLRGFYALLSIFPVLSVTFLLGGITGDFFWRAMLALVNAMFFSLAVGMFISSISRDSQRALIGTLLVMLFAIFAGPVADATIAETTGRNFIPQFALSSRALCSWPPKIPARDSSGTDWESHSSSHGVVLWRRAS